MGKKTKILAVVGVGVAALGFGAAKLRRNPV